MIYDVVVYLSSTNFRSYASIRKKQTLLSFASGARRMGATVEVVKDTTILPAKLAVILGWHSPYSGDAGVNLVRKNVIHFQAKNKNRTMPIDAGCWKYCDKDNRYLRYSLDGVFYDHAFYANKDSTSERYNSIATALKLELKPWKKTGDYVLLLMQRNSGWSMKGSSPIEWVIDKIQRLKTVTNKLIVVRPHPSVTITPEERKRILKFKGVTISDPAKRTLIEDIGTAYAAAVFNSSSGVAAIMEGVPLFIDDSSSVCAKVANMSLANFNAIEYPDREQWIYDLASCHWSDEESFAGDVFNKFKDFI